MMHRLLHRQSSTQWCLPFNCVGAGVAEHASAARQRVALLRRRTTFACCVHAYLHACIYMCLLGGSPISLYQLNVYTALSTRLHGHAAPVWRSVGLYVWGLGAAALDVFFVSHHTHQATLFFFKHRRRGPARDDDLVLSPCLCVCVCMRRLQARRYAFRLQLSNAGVTLLSSWLLCRQRFAAVGCVVSSSIALASP